MIPLNCRSGLVLIASLMVESEKLDRFARATAQQQGSDSLDMNYEILAEVSPQDLQAFAAHEFIALDIGPSYLLWVQVEILTDALPPAAGESLNDDRHSLLARPGSTPRCRNRDSRPRSPRTDRNPPPRDCAPARPRRVPKPGQRAAPLADISSIVCRSSAARGRSRPRPSTEEDNKRSGGPRWPGPRPHRPRTATASGCRRGRRRCSTRK